MVTFDTVSQDATVLKNIAVIIVTEGNYSIPIVLYEEGDCKQAKLLLLVHRPIKVPNDFDVKYFWLV